MIFRKDKSLAELAAEAELQPWFAWYPVRVAQTGKLVWLRPVLRERVLAIDIWTGKIWGMAVYYLPEAWISASKQ